MKTAVKIAILATAGFVSTACQHLSTPSKTSVTDAKVAMLNDASYLCQKQLQGDISFKHTNDEVKLYCTFTDKTGKSVEVDAVAMVRALAKDMVEGDTIKSN